MQGFERRACQGPFLIACGQCGFQYIVSCPAECHAHTVFWLGNSKGGASTFLFMRRTVAVEVCLCVCVLVLLGKTFLNTRQQVFLLNIAFPILFLFFEVQH